MADRTGDLSNLLAQLADDTIENGASPSLAATGDARFSPVGVLRVLHLLNAAPDLSAEEAAVAWAILERTVSGTCFRVPDQLAAFDDAIRVARAALVERGDAGRGRALARHFAASLSNPQRHRTLARAAHIARPLLSRLPSESLGQLADVVAAMPLPAAQGGEFASAGRALTDGEVKARVTVFADALALALRPAIADAMVRLLARSGVDVERPPVAGDSGQIADQLGLADAADGFVSANLAAWDRMLRRTAEDDRPEPVSAIVTSGVQCADTIQGYARRRSGIAAGKDVLELLAGAQDIAAWLSVNDIGPPKRWSSIRVGLLGPGDGRRRTIDGSPRTTAVSELLRNAGYTVRNLAEVGTSSGGVGVLPWLAPDLVMQLRDRHAAGVQAGRIDVLAVEDPSCLAVLSDWAPCPVVHLVELLDWAYGGPVPAGLDHLVPYVADVPGAQPIASGAPVPRETEPDR